MALTNCAEISSGGRWNSNSRNDFPDNPGGRIGALRRGRRVAIYASLRRVHRWRRALVQDPDLRVPVPHHGLVLGLGPSQCRLHGHDSLPLGCQPALLALARAVHAVALVALEGDLFAVVPATGAVRRRSWRCRRAGCVNVHLGFVLLCVRHS